MRTIALGPTGISASVLGFGCSALMGRSGRRESLRALATAWDAGVSFYDTARCYGYGESEAVLGAFLRGRRDRAVISTKFGIVPSRQVLWKQIAKPVARGMLSAIPSSRALLMKLGANQIAHDQFTPAVLAASIDESLRRLETDYVDFLFMHDAPESTLYRDDLLAALQALVEAGKVRVAGISSSPEIVAEAVRLRPAPLRAVQFPCNVFDLRAAATLRAADDTFAAIANHPFGGVERAQRSRAVLREIADAADTPPAIREKLGSVDDAALADAVINLLMYDSGIHVVVPAMMRVEHIAHAVTAVTASRFAAEDVRWLRDRLTHAESATAPA